MRLGPSACVLFGLVLLACSRADRATSSGNANDASGGHDATSAQTMPSVRDASLANDAEPQGADDIADAGDTVQDGAYGSPGSTCTVPSQARSSTACQVMLYPNDVPPHCSRPTEYELLCTEALDASTFGCNLIAIEDAPIRGYDYCCFCEGTDAATGCVNVDLSTYDRSCSKDSDCMAIASGTLCPGGACYFCCGGNAAINVDGKARYEQTIAPLSGAWSVVSGLPTAVCHCRNCGASSGPFCSHGVCTMNQ
jgi:hypothetical protein